MGDSLKIVEPPGPIIGLLSYPGSGNTWLRYLIQKSVGYVTGSVYFSEMLYKNGFPGEKFVNGSAIVVKSHLNSFKYDDTRLYVKLIRAQIIIFRPYFSTNPTFENPLPTSYSVNADF